MDYVLKCESGHINLSPHGFHMWARHYYKCKKDFISPDRFSVVLYFLLCRAIELEIKSKHLQHKNQKQIKSSFGHDLIRAYNALDDGYKSLSRDECIEMEKANNI